MGTESQPTITDIQNRLRTVFGMLFFSLGLNVLLAIIVIAFAFRWIVIYG